MSDPFIGEIRLVPYGFIPSGWVACNGQLLLIKQYSPLFSLLGTAYGGDGKNTFAVPNLIGSVPIGIGTGDGLTPRTIGEKGGSTTETLSINQMPFHSHNSLGTNGTGATSPTNNVWGVLPGRSTPFSYQSESPNVSMSPVAIDNTGGNGAHNNVQPYLVFNYVIATSGELPIRP
jgi:microcystin-dependent protein